MKHLHSSSRYDRSAASLAAATKNYVQQADLITFTELDEIKRERALIAALPKTWGYQGTGNKVWSDCGLAWNGAKFTKIESGNTRVSEAHWIGQNGKTKSNYTIAWAVLKEISTGHIYVVSVSHTPSGVETDVVNKRKTRVRAAWFSLVRGQKNFNNKLLSKHKAYGSLVVSDFNVNFKRRAVRVLFKTIASAHTQTWRNLNFKGGTHGNRVIDATLLRGKAKVVGSAKLFKDDASSDHRPYIETIA